MKNPIFKKQVDDLFEKLAWPFDPAQVQQQVDPQTARYIGRGRAMGSAARSVFEGGPDLLNALGRGAESVLAPASEATAKPFFGMLRGLKNFAIENPNITRNALGLAAIAPILGKAFHENQQGYEDRLMNLRADPGRDITASLDEFLEKKAAGGPPTNYLNPHQIGTTIQHGFFGGIGGNLAGSALNMLGGAISSGVGGLRDMLIGDKQRKRLFETLITTDVVLHDAIERNPDAIEMLKEAYGTMCRFAPSLAMDVNAVRSFLREAIVGGSGVNYATIKNLIETEKAHSFKR